MDWTEQAARHLAEACDLDPGALRLSAAEGELLLDLAAVAAHRSGDRRNAPLVCYLLGRAVATGAGLEDLAGALRAFAGEDDGS